MHCPWLVARTARNVQGAFSVLSGGNNPLFGRRTSDSLDTTFQGQEENIPEACY